MDRRSLLLGGSAGLVGAPVLGPVSAWANPKHDDDSERRLDRRRIRLTAQGVLSLVTLTYMVIVINNQLIGWNLQREFDRTPLDRVDGSKVPLFGGLLRPTVNARLQTMDFIGQFVLVNTLLVLVLSAAMAARPRRATLVHENSEFEIPGRPKPINAPGLIERASEGKFIPESGAYLDSDTGELIALIPEHLASIKPPKR